jgi:hypothetical protein
MWRPFKEDKPLEETSKARDVRSDRYRTLIYDSH